MKSRTLFIQARCSHKQVALLLMIGITVLVFSSPINAQTGGAAYYRYDANGRLTTVLSPTGEAVTYSYDPAGNFTSVTRYAANQLSILDFTPGSGGPTLPVTIYGTGFSATPSSNTVKFNGVTATVTAATNIRLDVQVPSGASTGPITVTNANGTINSSRNFYVSASIVEFNKSTTFGETTPFTFNNTVNRAPLVNVGIINFDAVSGQRISLFIDQIIFLSFLNGGLGSGLSPYADVSIISPSGSSLVLSPPSTTAFSIQDYPQYLNVFGYLDSLTLPESGTYSILIDPKNSLTDFPNQNEPYAFGGTIHLYDVTDITGTIPATGQPLPLNFSVPGQSAILTFTGLNGQRICLKGTQDVSTVINTNVKLFAPGAYPNGTPLAPTQIDTFFLDVTTLTANGTYTILVDPQFNKTRALTLNLYDVPPDVSDTLTVGAAAKAVAIPSVGQAANLTFNVSGSQLVTIHIRNLAIGNFADPSTLTLSIQGGAQIHTQTINSNADYDIQRNLPSAGTYVIKIDPQKAATGSLNIYLTTP